MEFDYRAREAQLSKVLGRVVFDLAGDDPGAVLMTIAKLRDATEACEAKYRRMVTGGVANGAQPVQQAAEQQGEQRRRGTRPPGRPRGTRRGQPPAAEQAKPSEAPAPLFADQTEGA